MRKASFTTLWAIASILSLSAFACNPKGKKADMKTSESKRVLVAYFSRTGENYGVGRITTGNTRIIAEMIARSTGADLFEIQPVESYPDGYEECTEVAQREKNSRLRPAIKENKDVTDYDIIYVGFPIWWGDAPMPVYTWLESQTWQGKTVIPFCTHEGSGLGDAPALIGAACPGATVGKGLAITGTTAQKRRADAQKAVDKWLAE